MHKSTVCLFDDSSAVLLGRPNSPGEAVSAAEAGGAGGGREALCTDPGHGSPAALY